MTAMEDKHGLDFLFAQKNVINQKQTNMHYKQRVIESQKLLSVNEDQLYNMYNDGNPESDDGSENRNPSVVSM